MKRATSGQGRREGTFAAIYAAVLRIPRGRVATYGQVAVLAGMPGAARTVGWALRALAGESHRGRLVPWHRVVGAGGRISLGETPSGQLQRARLGREGVRFRAGRVVLADCGLFADRRAS
jgi:methylated-DNA-protein-cysteine methyltransferase-like protein